MFADRDQRRRDGAGVLAAVVVAVAVLAWGLVLRLAWALWHNDLSLAYVADVSRADAPWQYRLAAIWGGSQGSLLLFTAVMATAGALGVARAGSRRVAAGAGATALALLALGMVSANPFVRRDAPAIRGRGLAPILEHPAMAIHPPVLYAGLGAALVAAIHVADGRDPTRPLRATVGLLTAAMALGAVWSYVEQGWGGYWAWDPVENTSLLVWIAALAALHAPHARRLATVPWLAALFGGAMVRSGRTPSVHGFAEHAAVGWGMLALAVVSLGWMWCVRARGWEHAPARRPAPGQGQAAVVLGVIGTLVVVGTFLPALAGWIGGRRVAVRGPYFSRALGPMAAAVAVMMVAAMRRREVRRGRNLLVHVGVLMLLGGFVATSFDRDERVRLGVGTPAPAAGMTVRLDTIDVIPGPRQGTSAVRVTVRVGGATMRPQLVAYPELRGVLAETSLRPGLWEDVSVALVDATDDGAAVLDVRRRPLTWLVWLGAALTTMGALPRRRGVAACAPGVPASSPVPSHP